MFLWMIEDTMWHLGRCHIVAWSIWVCRLQLDGGKVWDCCCNMKLGQCFGNLERIHYAASDHSLY
jgi:hypothetical protein